MFLTVSPSQQFCHMHRLSHRHTSRHRARPVRLQPPRDRIAPMLRRTFLAIPALAVAAEQRRSLKITGLETTLTISPKREPYYDALQTLGVHSGSVRLRLFTDAGITGYATSSFGA